MPTEPFLLDLASAVLSAVENHYPATGDMALPARRYISDGIPAWDCDQVTVQVLRTFPIIGSVIEEAPVELDVLERRAAEMAIEIVRCAATVQQEGEEVRVPTPGEIEESAERVLTDAETMADAIRTGYRNGLLPDCGGVAIMGWTGKGPEGGFVGGMLTVRLVLE